VTATIPVGKNPTAVSVNPSTNIAYVANFDEDTVSVIDCKTNKGIVTIPVGKNPTAVSVNPSTNKKIWHANLIHWSVDHRILS
jgi:YVTN family beta-propeller protein